MNYRELTHSAVMSVAPGRVLCWGGFVICSGFGAMLSVGLVPFVVL
jgi:hypothetical protein